MENQLSKFSDRELLEELAKIGHNFVGASPEINDEMHSNFLELSFGSIYEMASGDEEINEEFFDEHFDEVYFSVDWGNVHSKAMNYVIDFIRLTIRKKAKKVKKAKKAKKDKKAKKSYLYNDEIWEVKID